MAEHFVQPPHWEWYIVAYFFLAGLAAGSYTLGTMLQLVGAARDEATARIAFLIPFPLVAVCGALLTIDLGQPLRFWHMLINANTGGLMFKYWSPISLGSWALLLFGLFAFVAFLGALNRDRPVNRPGFLLINVLGSLVALFLASYTGVVLSVSNQPVWSDSWAIGALFVASALSGSTALLSWLAKSRGETDFTEHRLHKADAYFALLELIMIVIFFATLAIAGTLGKTLGGPWIVVWVLVLLSLIPPLMLLPGRRVEVRSAGGSTLVAQITSGSGRLAAIVVVLGVLLMRIAVIFSAQS